MKALKTLATAMLLPLFLATFAGADEGAPDAAKKPKLTYYFFDG